MRDALLSSAPNDTTMRSRATCISTMMSERNGVDNWLSVPFRRNPTASRPYAKQKLLPAVCLTTSKLMEVMSAPIPQPFSIWSNGQPCWIISNGAGCQHLSVLKTRRRLRGSMTAGLCHVTVALARRAPASERSPADLIGLITARKGLRKFSSFLWVIHNHIHHASFVCCC